jgi:hypothetical protein
VESLYVDAATSFIQRLNIPFLEIVDLEKHNLTHFSTYPQLYSEDMVRIFKTIKNNTRYEVETVNLICRLILREDLWLKLEYEHEFFIHFGYDYYMYIGSTKEDKVLIREIEKSGLFIEECKSPYLE